MADRNLALSLLISAKDAASAVLAKVREAVVKTNAESERFAQSSEKTAASNEKSNKVYADLVAKLTLTAREYQAQRLALQGLTKEQIAHVQALELEREKSQALQSQTGGLSAAFGGLTKQLVGLAAAYLSINGLKSAFESVISVGARFETLRIQITNLMGSLEAGEQATQWIKDFAKNTPLELEGVTKAFVRLKAFGMDPMDGSLQALTDLTSKLGGGQAELEGIVLAVGQAWSKQKLQTEEINQLVERGVPVWDLLTKVTGQNAAELQKLASAGALGRDVIKALIDEIGRSSQGASASMMQTWTGLISNLQDSWTNFLGDLANAGTLDAFKDQLRSIQILLANIASSEELQRGFTALATFLTGTAKIVEGVVVTAGFAVDQLGRSVGALAAKFGALLTLDFSALEAIDKAFAEDNQKAAAKWAELINSIQSPPPVEVKTNIDAKPVLEGLAQINIGANAAIEQFRNWGKESTATVDNVASELRKLSDIELANLRVALQQAFDGGNASADELQKALDSINTEQVTRAWKTLGQQSSASLKAAADSAKAAYVTIRESGTASAADLDKAWQAVTKQILAAKDATNAADAAEKQRKQNLATLDQIGATPEEKLAAKRKELTDQTIAYDKAKRQGDFAEAARIAQEKEQLAFQNAQAEAEAANAGEVAGYRAYDAKQAYLRAINDTKKALAELSQQEQAALTTNNGAPNPLQQQATEAAKLQETLALLKQPINMQITSNFAAQLQLVEQLQARVNALNASASNGATGNASVEATDQALSTEVLKRGSRT